MEFERYFRSRDASKLPLKFTCHSLKKKERFARFLYREIQISHGVVWIKEKPWQPVSIEVNTAILVCAQWRR